MMIPIPIILCYFLSLLKNIYEHLISPFFTLLFLVIHSPIHNPTYHTTGPSPQGIWAAGEAGADINAVARSNSVSIWLAVSFVSFVLFLFSIFTFYFICELFVRFATTILGPSCRRIGRPGEDQSVPLPLHQGGRAVPVLRRPLLARNERALDGCG